MNIDCIERISCFDNADAAFSLRNGGESSGNYASLNLGDHVGDDPKIVEKNRLKFEQAFGHRCVFMHQLHGTKATLIRKIPDFSPECDAIVTDVKGLGLAVMTADCLPLLLQTGDGKVCAAVHCGWKGLARGIVRNTVSLIRKLSTSSLEAYTGPCIGPLSFEVGPEVRDEFVHAFGSDANSAFKTSRADRLLCSLPELTSLALMQSGVEIAKIVHSGCDTFKEKERFFSYRRHAVTGRMVTVISLR